MIETLFQDLPQGLLCWYDFSSARRILCIGEGAIARLLHTRCKDVVVVEEYAQDDTFFEHNKGTFDFVVAVDVLSYDKAPEKTLARWRQVLTETGVLLLAFHNRLGLRFFCGERDPFTNRNFDGIENYRRSGDLTGTMGRYYAKSEMNTFLNKAGFENPYYFNVLPTIDFAQQLYAEDYALNEDLTIRVFPKYHNPEQVFLEERYLYQSIVDNGLLDGMANGYLVECRLDGTQNDVLHATSSLERGKNEAMVTTILRNGTVVKKAAYAEGAHKVHALHIHATDLQQRGFSVVEGVVKDGGYTMPFIKGKSAVTHLRDLFFEDFEAFERELDAWYHMILQSSEHVEENELGVILKNGYFELVPVNAFYDNGAYTFFDQEFCLPNLPAKVIMYRVIVILYYAQLKMHAHIPETYFFDRYGISDPQCFSEIYRLEHDFYETLVNMHALSTYFEKNQVSHELMSTNRQKINFSSTQYRRQFIDIFQDIDDKQIALFGTGNYTKKFLALYRFDYPIAYMVDNNPEKWGTMVDGIEVRSPEVLKEAENIKVIVCIKNYSAILTQLQQYGIEDFGVYDPLYTYKQRKTKSFEPNDDTTQKNYQTGYIAGVFDMFHIGHLNLLRRAKEQCEHLLVGVVSDDGVSKHKKTQSVIPMHDRLAIVSACKYVDEAFILPLDMADSMTALRLYGFDCQFSGSDYVDDPWWLSTQQQLREAGADLIFLPYTQGTSSSELKKALNLESSK